MELQTRRVRALGLIEKTILGFIAGAAAAIGIIDLVLLVIRSIDTLTASETVVTGLTLADDAAPVFTDASRAVTAASYDSVTLTIEGLPGNIRILLVAATVLGSLVTMSICAVLVWLCIRVFLGRPFVTSATWGIGIVAIVVIVGHLGSTLLSSVANAEVAGFLGDAGDSLATFWVTIDLAPLGWAIALAVVGAAFEIGQRMQRETAGLV